MIFLKLFLIQEIITLIMMKTDKKNALFGEKLVDATELLRLILEYHLLRELGFNDDFATNNMRDSFGQINIHMGYFENHLNQ
ncbi:hypothetical protein AAX19_09370 [Oenococcus oeni]|nr:hypothetical protein AAX19_09370 [Oenococcus oeni]